MTHGRYSLYCFITLCLSVANSQNHTCYYPDGSEAYGRTPCNSGASQSHCCSPNDLCLSNGLCWGYGDSWANRLIRDSCTDPGFKDPACPQHCQAFDDTVDSAARTILMVDDSPQGKFCCVAGVKNASANTGWNNVTDLCGYMDSPSGSYVPFALGEGLAIANRSDGSTGENNTDTAVAAASASGGSNSSSVAVGAGVGVSLGVVWLATLAVLIWKWKQADHYRSEAATAAERAVGAWYPPLPAPGSEKYPSELSPYAAVPPEMASEQPPRELDATK